VIDVGQEQVQRAYALHEARFEPAPFVRRNDPRHEIERNESLGARLLAIHGERDTDAMKKPLGLFAFLGDAVGRRALQPVGEGPVMRPDVTVLRTHFVVDQRRHQGLYRRGVHRKQSASQPGKTFEKQSSVGSEPRPPHSANPVPTPKCTKAVRYCPGRTSTKLGIGFELAPSVWLNRGSCLGSRGG
jgi:hypothetical protein